MKLLILTITLFCVTSGCVSKPPSVYEACLPEFPPRPKITKQDLPDHDEATKEQYRVAAIMIMQSLLIREHLYKSARKCAKTFEKNQTK